MENRHNVKEYYELSDKAKDSCLLFVEFSLGCAQGEPRTVYLMYENGEACHISYENDICPIFICPVIEEWHERTEKLKSFPAIETELADEILTPQCWCYYNMGCGNFLFWNKKVDSLFTARTSSFDEGDYYRCWFEVASDIITCTKSSLRKSKIKALWRKLMNISSPEQSFIGEKTSDGWKIYDFVKWGDTTDAKQKTVLRHILSSGNSYDLCTSRLWLRKVDNPQAIVMICDRGFQFLHIGDVKAVDDEGNNSTDDYPNSEIMKVIIDEMKEYVGEHCSVGEYRLGYHQYGNEYHDYRIILDDYVKMTKRLYDESKDQDCFRDYVWALMTAVDEGLYDPFINELCSVIEYISSEKDLLLKFNCCLLIADKMRDNFPGMALKSIDYYKKSLHMVKSLCLSYLDYCVPFEEYENYIFEEIYKIADKYAKCLSEKDSNFYAIVKEFSEITEPYRDKIFWIGRNAYCSGCFERQDPIENLENYVKVKDEVDQKLEMLFADVKKGFGFCHTYWRVKHRMLRDCYGIWWRSVHDMHPANCYD